MQASLRKNKINLSHYHDGILGCGKTNEDMIRDIFFDLIKIIKDRIMMERTPDRLV